MAVDVAVRRRTMCGALDAARTDVSQAEEAVRELSQ
jgi:hypothetical protein